MRKQKFGSFRVLHRCLLVGLCALVLQLFTVGTVSARDHVIKYSGSGAAGSDCIGDVSEIVCAVDTWIACLRRKDTALCGALGINGVKFRRGYKPNPIQYLVFDWIPRSHSFAVYNVRDKPIFDFDYMEVRVLQRECRGKKTATACSGKFSKAAYYFAKTDKRWRLVGWTHETDATCGYHDIDGERFEGECKLFVSQRPGFEIWPF